MGFFPDISQFQKPPDMSAPKPAGFNQQQFAQQTYAGLGNALKNFFTQRNVASPAAPSISPPTTSNPVNIVGYNFNIPTPYNTSQAKTTTPVQSIPGQNFSPYNPGLTAAQGLALSKGGTQLTQEQLQQIGQNTQPKTALNQNIAAGSSKSQGAPPPQLSQNNAPMDTLGGNNGIPQASLPATGGTDTSNRAADFSAVVKSFIDMPDDVKQALGYGTDKATLAKIDNLQQTLDKMTALQNQLVQAAAPTDQIKALDQQIASQQQALNDLTPRQFLDTQKGLKEEGITNSQLNREVAMRREPIARALSDLLFSRSALGQIQTQEINSIKDQMTGVTQQSSIQDAINTLKNQGAALPPELARALSDQFVKNIFPTPSTAQPTANIQDYNLYRSQGGKGGFLDFLRQQKQATTININNPSSSDILSTAQQLIDGQIAPSQLSKRTGSYYTILDKANQLSMQQNGVPYDAITADQQFAFGKNTQTQRIMVAIKTALQTTQRAISNSDKVDRTSLQFANGIVVGTKSAFSDPATSQWITDINGLADEIGTVLGQGQATDFKTRLGLIIANQKLGKEGFRSAMNELAVLFKNKLNNTLEQAGKELIPNTENNQDFYSQEQSQLPPGLISQPQTGGGGIFGSIKNFLFGQ